MNVSKNSLTALTAACVGMACAPQADAALAAYVHIWKNDAADTRFHLSEVEAFVGGVSPDELGGSTFDGLATSTNDIAGAVAFGSGNSFPVIGTTNALEHGGANTNPNNVLENVGNVWSTANGLGAAGAQYTLDLGGVHDVTTVRMWPRADGCCANRWENLEIQLLDENLNPVPGTLNLHTANVGNVALEFTYAPVPEPSGTALLSLAAAGFLIRRRR